MKRKLTKGTKATTSMPIEVKGIDRDNYTLTMVASTQTEDRHGDVVVQSGWDLKSYKKNPVILNSHNYDDATEVIAKATRTEVVGKGKKSRLEQDWKFAVEENPKAKILFDLYAGGFLNASSVGFIPKKFAEDKKDGTIDYFTIEEAELLEVSAVSVPANARALAKAKGIDVEMLKSEHEESEEIDNPTDDEVSEDSQVSPDEGATPTGDGDGGESGSPEGEPAGEGSADDQEGDGVVETDQKGGNGDEETKNLDQALGEETDEENGDDGIIQDTGKSYTSRVTDVVKRLNGQRDQKLKRVMGIVQDMLDSDKKGAKLEQSIKEKVRKRKINQAIRTLNSLK